MKLHTNTIGDIYASEIHYVEAFPGVVLGHHLIAPITEEMALKWYKNVLTAFDHFPRKFFAPAENVPSHAVVSVLSLYPHDHTQELLGLVTIHFPQKDDSDLYGQLKRLVEGDAIDWERDAIRWMP